MSDPERWAENMKRAAIFLIGATLMSTACTKTEIFLPCPYSGQSVLGEIFYEQGGFETKQGYQAKYVIFAPRSTEVVTLGVNDRGAKKGFDSLFIRAGAVDGTLVPLSPDITVIFMKADGYTTKEIIELYSWSAPMGELFALMQPMWKQNPSGIADVKAYLKEHGGEKFRKRK